MFWKRKVKVGSHIIVRPWGGAEYAVTVKELDGSGGGRRARVRGHAQVDGSWVNQAFWVREVK